MTFFNRAVHLKEIGFSKALARLRGSEINDRAAAAYVPQPYHGHIIDFQPRTPSLFQVASRGTGWSKFTTGGVTVKVIPGSHQSIFKEPRVRLWPDS